MALEVGRMNILVALGLTAGAGKDLAGELDKAVGPAAEKASKSISDKLGAGLSKAGGALTKGLTAPLLALGAGVVAAGLEVDGALDNIRIKTGATGAELEGLQESFKNVGKQSTQSLGDVSTIITDLNTKLGLTGKPLEALALQLTDLAQITEQPVNTDSITKLFQAYQIPIEQQQGLLDQIFRASQASGVGFDALLETAVSQSAVFKELGFSVQDGIALAATLEKAGVNADSVLAGIRKSILKVGGGAGDLAKIEEVIAKATSSVESSTLDLAVAEQKLLEVRADPKAKESAILSAEANVTKLKKEIESAQGIILQGNKEIATAAKNTGIDAGEFFKQSLKGIEDLLKAGDETGAREAAKDLFGAKGYLDAIEAIKANKFDTSAITNEINNGTDSISGLAAETADFPEQLKKFKNELSISLAPLGQSLFPAISNAIQTLLPLIIGLVDKFNALSPEAQKFIVIGAGFAAALGPVLTITGQFISAFSGIAKAVKAINALFVASPWVLALVAIVAIGFLIYKNWDSIFAFFKAGFEKFLVVVQAVWGAVAAAAKLAIDFVVLVFTGWVIIITGLIDAVKLIFSLLWTGIVEGVKLAVGFSGLGLLIKVVQLIIKNWDGIKAFFSNFFTFLVNIVKNIGGALVAPFVNAFNLIKNVVTSVIGFIVQKFDMVKAKILDVVKGIGNIPGQVLSKIPVIGGLFRAEGGPVKGGQPYIVGERGPELVVPKSAGTVIPNNMLGALSSGSGDTYNIVVNNPMAEATSTSIPNALRRTAYLRSN